MKKKIEAFLRALLSFLLIAAIVKAHYSYAKGFRINKIIYQAPYNSRWAFDREGFDRLTCLDHEFSYLGKGRQAYVFEARDKKYVLKFIRYHKYGRPLWGRIYHFLPFESKWLERILKEKKERYRRAMESYRIARERLKRETGVVFTHLNRSDDLRKKVKLRFAPGRKLAVDLDKTAFIIQKRADSLRDTLLGLREKNEIEAIKELIGAFIETFAKRCQRGILNRDFMNSLRNSGCVANRVLEVDIGSFYYESSFDYEKEMAGSMIPLRRFIKEEMPELLAYFDDRLKRKTEKGKL